MLHGLTLSKLVLLSTLIVTHSNARNSHTLQYQRHILKVYGAHPTKLIVTWLVPDRAIKGKSQKVLKDNQGWEKTVLFKKHNPPVFLFFLIRTFLFFLKEIDFCYFFKKTQKPHSELFLLHHAISPFSELRNNNLLYLLWHSNLRVKKCIHFCFRKVLLVNSFHSGKAWQERAQ